MGSGLSNIANSVNSTLSNAGNDINSTGLTGSLTMGPLGMAGDAISAMNPSSPSAPGANSGLQGLENGQISAANQFSQNMPGMESQANQNLRNSANQGLNSTLNMQKSQGASRGLLYGGVEAGKEGAETSKSQTNLSNAINTSNVGFQNEANTLNQNAISTGAGIQGSQQAIQNDIYSQAQAQMNANNSMIGSMASTGLLALLM